MGKLFVVGIGPGSYENMTMRAQQALAGCDIIVGYNVYVDLVKEHFADKEFLTTPMRREVERCELALEKAAEGNTVAMICSGDAGVYGRRISSCASTILPATCARIICRRPATSCCSIFLPKRSAVL